MKISDYYFNKYTTNKYNKNILVKIDKLLIE